MRMVRWLIPLLVLMGSLLACFATTPEDDSSVPMSGKTPIDSSSPDLPTFTPAPPTPGPSPTPYPTTAPTSLPDTTPSDSDGEGGLNILMLLVVMGVVFTVFAVVVGSNRWQRPKR